MPVGELLSGIAAIVKTASDKNVRADAQRLIQYIRSHPEARYKDNNATITSKALHRMQQGSSPRIAVVGITGSGKSSLVNKLFGSPLADVKRTPDTTSSVLRVEFPSGLVVYDTPGVFGDEKFPYENITRLFLDIPQDSDLSKVQQVPYRASASVADPTNLSLEKIKEIAPIDTVLWVVKASETPNRLYKKAFEAFYLQLKGRYEGHVVVAGTHLDLLDSATVEEKNRMLELWAEISEGHLIPVSSLEGKEEGLDALVLALFRTLADKTSLAKLQASLLTERKLNRLSFVITETSTLLSSIILLDGEKEEEIKIASVTLFAFICNHYSVDEETWLKYHGNALEIGTLAPSVGKAVVNKVRKPKNLWERIRSVFGAKFFDKETKYYPLGVRGIEILLPSIYRILYEFEEPETSELSDEDVLKSVKVSAKSLKSLIDKRNESELAIKIGELLTSLFSGAK